MTPNNLPAPASRDLLFIQLAREIAIDHHDTETILKLHSVSTEQWENIQRDARFVALLESEVVAWQSATNTAERTRLKAGAMIEEWLPEANARIHDQNENLNSKTELAKFLGKVAGFDRTGSEGGGSNGFSVTINLGAESIRLERQPKIIDADVL